MAEEVPDVKKKRRYHNANIKMEESFPNLLDKAKDVLENPDDPEAQKTLENAEGEFQKALEEVGKVTRQPNLNENLERLKNKLAELEDAKKRKDPNDLDK